MRISGPSSSRIRDYKNYQKIHHCAGLFESREMADGGTGKASRAPGVGLG
jgi:hypothetical protein